MIRRPKPGETEEDLLRQQQEFLASRQSASASVVKRPEKRKTETEGGGETRGEAVKVKKDVVQLAGLSMSSATFEPSSGLKKKKKSRFQKQRPTTTGGSAQRVTFDLDEDEEEDPERAMEERDTHITAILSKIMEHDASPSAGFIPRTTNQGFPSVMHRDSSAKQQGQESGTAKKKKKKQSLFAQQFDGTSPSVFGLSEPSLVSPPLPASVVVPALPAETAQPGAGGAAVPASAGSGEAGWSERPLGPADWGAIGRESEAQLAQMSEETVLEEQRRLKAVLDPSLVAFLQSRHKKPSEGSTMNPNPTTGTDSGQEATEAMETELIGRLSEEQAPGAASGVTDGERPAAVQEEERREDCSHDEAQATAKARGQWVHMDQPEPEKLRWMSDLPKPSATSRQGAQARFDFSGLLVARDAEVPVREGLHHHGDEQELPGYSLEELFSLSRSAVTQQRVLALQTLARVIYNSRMRQLGGDLQEPLLPRLLDAGLLFLLRWSLDDVNEGVMTAATEGLAAALIQPGDEDTLDRVFRWHRGPEAAPMHPGSTTSADAEADVTEEGEEIREEDKSDRRVARQDAVKGLLRMRLLPRLRYILEVVRPPAPTVLNALAILVRICRHSMGAAHEVMKCPRLLQTVWKEFLPTASWRHQEGIVTDVYGYPVVLAMKLMNVLCVAGRNFASSLLGSGRLMPAILRYITMEPADMQLNIAEAYELSTISLHVWTVCVGYGLACEEYRELYPLLMQQLALFRRLSVLPLDPTIEDSDRAVHRLQMSRTAALLALLEGVVNVAGTAERLRAKLVMSSDLTGMSAAAAAASSAPQPPPPAVDWSHVDGLQPPLEFCCFRWLSELTGTTVTPDAQATDLVAGLLSLRASFYEKCTQQAGYRPVDCLHSIENLVATSLVPFMTSSTFFNVMVNLKFQSALRHAEDPSAVYPPSLPDLGCHPGEQDRSYPAARRDSTCGLAASLLRLVHTLLRIHKGVAAKFCPIVANTYVTSYLERICKNVRQPSSQLGSCFARFEHQALYYLLKLYHSVVQQDESCRQYSVLYHTAALSLFAHLQPGDEHYAHDLMSTVLFNGDFIAEGRIGAPIAADLADLLHVTGGGSDRGQTRREPAQTGPSRGELLQEAYDHLPGISSLYMVFFGTAAESLAKSRSRSLHVPHEIDTYMLPEFAGTLLPVDWMFLPLLHLHTEAQKAEVRGKSVVALPPHLLGAVADALRWIFLLETWRPQSLQTVPQAAKIARIYCVFLTGSDLFLEDSIRRYLSPLLSLYTRPENLEQLDFDAPVPGVTSFYDLYMEVLTQFEAVSFGDPLFAHFVLLPIQQRFGGGIRKALWCEHASALRALHVPLSQLILPLENFLHPRETNLELLQIYLSSLAGGAVRQAWSPLMYLVGLHHLSGFLFDQSPPGQSESIKVRLRMLRQLASIRDKVIVDHVTRYQGPDISSPCGFSLHPSVPEERAAIVQAAAKR